MWRKWWYGWQLKQALKSNKLARADYYLQQLDDCSQQLPLLAKIYKQKLAAEQKIAEYQSKNVRLISSLQHSQDKFYSPDYNFIEQVRKKFELKECNEYLYRVTGIDDELFNHLELALAEFVEVEIAKARSHFSPEVADTKLKEAVEDLSGLKQGIDPSYDLLFSPHVYFLRYFVENIYANYLAWFLVYQSGLLPRELKLLDIAAGSGTTVYGLALLAISARKHRFLPLHICYYSLEKQDKLQYRGLQFWRSYMESLAAPVNAYFRFNTLDIFDYESYRNKLPGQFFNFIVISHCLFYGLAEREASLKIYRDIFARSLASNGSVMLIIQVRKLFNLYNGSPSEDIAEEKNAIALLMEDLGLELQWYRYLSSTGKRVPIEREFARYARDNLPQQSHIGKLQQKYFNLSYISSYVVDDYVILAKKLG